MRYIFGHENFSFAESILVTMQKPLYDWSNERMAGKYPSERNFPDCATIAAPILLLSPQNAYRKTSGGSWRREARGHFPRPRHCVKSFDAAFYPGRKRVAGQKAEMHHRLTGG
jgi:hypothetical protein